MFSARSTDEHQDSPCGLRGLASHLMFAQQNATSGIKISVYPNPVYIEKLESGQSVAADFGIENRTAEKLTLKSLTVSVYDDAGKLSFRKTLNDERKNTVYVPDRGVPGGKTLQMSNPLSLFDTHLVLGKLKYDFIFSTDDQKRDYSYSVEFAPLAYRQRTELNLPLKRGNLLFVEAAVV